MFADGRGWDFGVICVVFGSLGGFFVFCLGGVGSGAGMESLITLVNKLQRACTALGDYGEENALPTLWDALPSIAVVGGQVRSIPIPDPAFLRIGAFFAAR